MKSKKTWKDINLRTFLKIQEIVAEPDDYTRCNLIDLVYGVDSYNLPISQLKDYPIEFLSEKPEGEKLRDSYTVCGRRYDSNFNLTVIQTNQFIDYQNYVKGGNPKYEDILSVFFIPHGHTYNDGYDLAQVKADVMELPITTVIGMANFFEAQFHVYAQISLTSLAEQGKEMKLSQSEKRVMRVMYDRLLGGGLFPSFSQSLKRLVSRGRA